MNNSSQFFFRLLIFCATFLFLIGLILRIFATKTIMPMLRRVAMIPIVLSELGKIFIVIVLFVLAIIGVYPATKISGSNATWKTPERPRRTNK